MLEPYPFNRKAEFQQWNKNSQSKAVQPLHTLFQFKSPVKFYTFMSYMRVFHINLYAKYTRMKTDKSMMLCFRGRDGHIKLVYMLTMECMKTVSSVNFFGSHPGFLFFVHIV